MPVEKYPRADKFLWSVRIFKTRSLSGEACSMGRVKINGVAVKPSRQIKLNEVIEIKKPPVVYTYKVTGLPGSRVSASLVPDFIMDLTSPDEILKLKNQDTFFMTRDPRTGRPTKKERRLIDKLEEDF